jgi:flagellar biosynthesis anti-sigma factor FlgM
MKIGNNGISPLAPKPTDPAQRMQKKSSNQAVRSAGQSHDKTELSEQARLLARSRAAVDGVDEGPESAQVQKLRVQVQDGTYQVQVESIAKKLVAGIFSKG